MRAYISGAITGTDDFMERFRVVEERLEAEGMVVINPIRLMQILICRKIRPMRNT